MSLSSIDLSRARRSLIPESRSGKKQFCKSVCFKVVEDRCCKHRACITGLVEAGFSTVLQKLGNFTSDCDSSNVRGNRSIKNSLP